MDPHVLVVGAGPVGLTMAAELARYGVSVRIIDKASHASDKSKALVLWSRTLELLDRARCVDGFLAAGHRAKAANIIASDRLIGRIGFTDVDSPFPFALMLPQSDTERLIEAHLRSQGVSVERQVELIGFDQSQSGIVATMRHPEGHEEAVQVAWLIGCDGAHSTVRHALGLSFEGDTLDTDWVLADVHLQGMRLPASELALYWHADGMLAVFPIAADRYRVIADLGASHGARPVDPTLEQVQALVDQRGPGGLVVSDPVWLSAFRINERKVRDYRSGRVFLAGDAAHVHSPAGGQGMNTGMQDAFNLAWKLALVCRHPCNVALLLDSYSAERSAVGDQVLANAGRLTTVAVMRSHPAQLLRNLLGGFLLGLAPLRRALADTLTEVSIGYPGSPLNGPVLHAVDAPAPGEPARPIAAQVPVGAGSAPRFALFAAPGDAVFDLLRDHADLLEPDLRPPLGDRGMWLVRPDGYVACVAHVGDATTIAAYLEHVAQTIDQR